MRGLANGTTLDEKRLGQWRLGRCSRRQFRVLSPMVHLLADASAEAAGGRFGGLEPLSIRLRPLELCSRSVMDPQTMRTESLQGWPWRRAVQTVRRWRVGRPSVSRRSAARSAYDGLPRGWPNTSGQRDRLRRAKLRDDLEAPLARSSRRAAPRAAWTANETSVEARRRRQTRPPRDGRWWLQSVARSPTNASPLDDNQAHQYQHGSLPGRCAPPRGWEAERARRAIRATCSTVTARFALLRPRLFSTRAASGIC